jgi:hypothetical protein
MKGPGREYIALLVCTNTETYESSHSVVADLYTKVTAEAVARMQLSTYLIHWTSEMQSRFV